MDDKKSSAKMNFLLLIGEKLIHSLRQQSIAIIQNCLDGPDFNENFPESESFKTLLDVRD